MDFAAVVLNLLILWESPRGSNLTTWSTFIK